MVAYPITHAQFEAFLNARDGYGADDWWQGIAKEKSVGGRLRRHGNYPATHVSW